VKVLLVEDNERVTRFVVKGLQEAGHVADHADNGRDGMFLAASEPYDVIIMDRMLPGQIDGLAIIEALRKSGKPDEAAAAMARFQELNRAVLDARQAQTKAQGLYEQGMTFLQKDDFSHAYQAFKSAVELLPQLDAGFYRLAQLEYLGGDRPLASNTIRHALELNPFESEYYFVLARCLQETDAKAALDALVMLVDGDFQDGP